jgi:hypothetical protein
MNLPLCCPRCGSHNVKHVSYVDWAGPSRALVGGEWCCQGCGDTCENPMAIIAAVPWLDMAVGAALIAGLACSTLFLML